MTFPNYPAKHLEEALFGADEVVRDIASRKNIPKSFPESYVLIYDRKLLSRLKRKYHLKLISESFANMRIYEYNGLGLVKMTGIGAPHAVVVFEELVALGGKRFVNIGTAGGLQTEGVFLCQKAIRDEGTSSHYLAHEKYSYPDKDLTRLLGKSLDKVKLNYLPSTTWTIDSPYRETKAEVKQYKSEGVATVEMEASALFAVAKLRKVKIASAFVVSDVLGEKWVPQFHHFNTKEGLNKLVEAAFDCLKK